MRSIVTKIAVVFSLIGFFQIANAQSEGYREIWNCSLNEGKTLEDVHAANSKWVVFINANVAGGGITSHVLTTTVGNVTPGHFLYLDSFPTLESWALAKTATQDNPEGEAIDAELSEVADCSENRLFGADQS